MLRASNTVPQRSFVVTVNHVTGVPLAGLEPGELLVNEPRDRVVPLKVTVLREVLNPASDVPNVVVPATERSRVQAQGLTVWTPLGFLVLGVAAELRENAACFVDRRSVEQRLAAEANLHPALVRHLRAVVDMDTIVHTLRVLIRDGIPLNHLREIAERLIDIRLDGPLEQPPDPVQLVREGLPRTMAARFAGRFRTFPAYLVDPAVEEALRADPRADATTCDVLDALRGEVESLPEGVKIPGLLTAPDVRARLQDVVAAEYPRVPVLTYAELPADVNVQPIARLTLPQQPTQRREQR